MFRNIRALSRMVGKLSNTQGGSSRLAPPRPLDREGLLQKPTARLLSYEEIKPRTQRPTPNTYLIDVREPKEVRLGKIPSAVNLPLSTLPESLHLGKDAFRAKYGFEKPRVDQELIFYCRSGVRSTKATDLAQRNGYQNIYNYQGSWLDWVYKET